MFKGGMYFTPYIEAWTPQEQTPWKECNEVTRKLDHFASNVRPSTAKLPLLGIRASCSVSPNSKSITMKLLPTCANKAQERNTLLA